MKRPVGAGCILRVPQTKITPLVAPAFNNNGCINGIPGQHSEIFFPVKKKSCCIKILSEGMTPHEMQPFKKTIKLIREGHIGIKKSHD